MQKEHPSTAESLRHCRQKENTHAGLRSLREGHLPSEQRGGVADSYRNARAQRSSRAEGMSPPCRPAWEGSAATPAGQNRFHRQAQHSPEHAVRREVGYREKSCCAAFFFFHAASACSSARRSRYAPIPCQRYTSGRYHVHAAHTVAPSPSSSGAVYSRRVPRRAFNAARAHDVPTTPCPYIVSPAAASLSAQRCCF